MKNGKKKLAAVVADVVFRFQKYPGTDDDSVINLGDGKLQGSATPVKPQGKGFYGVKVPQDGELEFEVRGTRWRIVQKSEPVETGQDEERPLIVSWSKLGDATKPAGQQRRLQILGYYSGPVDGMVGAGTERAILGFQTDQKLRSDAIAGPTTRAKVLNVIESAAVHPDTAKDYIVRVCPLAFTRAPLPDATKSVGPAAAEAPDPDDRGFLAVPTVPNVVGEDSRGTIVPLAKSLVSRIKVVRRHLGRDVPIVASTSKPDVVDVVTKGRLPSTREFILELQGLKEGFSDVEILLDDPKRVALGTFRAIVLENRIVRIRPYFVGIGAGGPPVVGPLYPTENKAFFDDAFRAARGIWAPYGVRLVFLGWRDKTLNLATAGVLETTKADFDSLLNANDSAGRAAETNVLNLFLVREVKDAFGIAWDTLDFEWPQGIAIARHPTKGKRGTAGTIAHEIGHFLGLANCFPPNSYVHADDDPDDNNKKDDMWSLRRLMYAYSAWPPKPQAHRENTGYGANYRGCLVTVRNNPRDRTDDECRGARKHILSPTFYKRP